MRKSILLVVENLPVPYDRRVWQEALALRSAGWKVSVISPATSRHPALHERIEEVQVYRYPMIIEGSSKAGLIFEYFWAFFCIFFLTIYADLVRGFSVIMVANPPDIFFPILRMWRILGKKTIFDHHDLTPELFFTKYNKRKSIILNFFYFCERQTLRTVHKVIVTNESYREIAFSRGGRKDDDVVVVRNSPDPTRFSLRSPDLDLKKSARMMVAFLGEIGRQDGVDVLIRSIKTINDRCGLDAVHWVLMGGGPDYARVVAYAESIGVAESITFTGRADNDLICRVLSSADIAVDPCPFSPHADVSTATKVMEYMYFSLPIVAFALSETKRSGGDTVCYARIDDEGDFAAQIIRLLSDTNMRETLGRAGRLRLESELSWKRSSFNLVTLMNSLVESDAVAGYRDASTVPAKRH